MSDVETYIKAFNDLNIDNLMLQFENHCFHADTLVFRKDQDVAESHHFESPEHAQEFIGARCGKFEILDSDMTCPRLFVCPCGETGTCNSFLEWYEDCDMAYVNFRHHGHDTKDGQSRLNKYHVSLIRLFVKFFWRDNKTVVWNLDNICFCFKMMYGPKNPLYYLTKYDFACLGLYEFKNLKGEDISEQAWHYKLLDSELALKDKTFFSTVSGGSKCKENMTPWRCRGFTSEEWLDVNENIWTDRENLVDQPIMVISGKAFLMAKNFLEFSNTLLRILHISNTVFAKERDLGMNSYAYIDLCGLWPALDWKRRGMMKISSRGIYMFREEDAMQIYGKLAMPPILEIMFQSVTISDNVLPNPNFGEFGSKFRDYLVQVRAYLKAVHYNKPVTQMLLLNGQDKTAYMDYLGDFENCGNSIRIDKFKRREYVRWDNRKKKYILEKNKEAPANIWSTLYVPSNGYVSSRLYRLTGIPIGSLLRRMKNCDKNEENGQSTLGASLKKPTATLQVVLGQETDDDEYKSADDGTGKNSSVTKNNEKKKAKKTKSKKNKK